MESERLPDYYKVLGVDKDADSTAIKKRHRKLVLACHPDKFKDASVEHKAEKAKHFHEVQNAYQVLIDEKERATYDAKLNLEQLRQERLERSHAGADATTTRPVAQNSRYCFVAQAQYGLSSESARYRKEFGQPDLDKALNGRMNNVSSHEHHNGDRGARRTVPFRSDDSSDDEESRIRPAYKRGVIYPTGTLRQTRNIPAVISRPSHSQRSPSTYYKYPQPSRWGGLNGVSGYIGRHKVTALADTGAAQNCIRRQHALDLNLKVRNLELDEPQSFVMGHGKHIQVIGAVDCNWKFATDSERVYITLYVIPDCIFKIILGADFLFDTETMTGKRHRLSPMKASRSALKIPIVGLCGTPVRCLRGTLNSIECSALPDSGAEPNLIAYDYAEARGWLLEMYEGPESCQLLQFADGSTETVSGRLRLQWNFLTGLGPVTSNKRPYYEFDVLHGCPFDVMLGCTFLDDTEAFVKHMGSMHEIVKDSPSGMSIVVWVKSILKKGSKTKKPVPPEIQERDRRKRERDAEFERLAKVDANRWYQSHGIANTTDPSANSRSATTPTLVHKHGDVGSLDPASKSPSATVQTLELARRLLQQRNASNSTTSSTSSRSRSTTITNNA
jgi:curved DNA-binding protein CbpA